MSSKAHVVALGNAGYSTWDKLRCVINHWDAVAALLGVEGPAAATLLLSKVTHEAF